MQGKGGLHFLCSEPGRLQGQIFFPSLLIRKLVTALPFEGKPCPWGSCACADVPGELVRSICLVLGVLPSLTSPAALGSTSLFSSLLLLDLQAVSLAGHLPSNGSPQLRMNCCADLKGITSMGGDGWQRISTISFLALVLSPRKPLGKGVLPLLPSQAGENLA